MLPSPPTKINYITIINTFWNEAIYLDGYKANYGILFFALLDSINKNNWNDTEIHFESVLSKSKISRVTCLDARKWLKNNGFITIVEGTGSNSKAKFGIIGASRYCLDFIEPPTVVEVEIIKEIEVLLPKPEKVKKVVEPSKYLFEEFWVLYGKYGNKKTSQERFLKISEEHKAFMLVHIPKYVESTPVIKYRKHFETYLNKQAYLDEIINNGNINVDRTPKIDKSVSALGLQVPRERNNQTMSEFLAEKRSKSI